MNEGVQRYEGQSPGRLNVFLRVLCICTVFSSKILYLEKRKIIDRDVGNRFFAMFYVHRPCTLQKIEPFLSPGRGRRRRARPLIAKGNAACHACPIAGARIENRLDVNPYITVTPILQNQS